MYKQDKFVGRTLLKKYNIVRKLGEGSFGCIYKAVHKSQFYALKIEKKTYKVPYFRNLFILYIYVLKKLSIYITCVV